MDAARAPSGQAPTRKRTNSPARTGLVEHLGDGLLGVLGERLLEQDVLLEVAVDPALDDLRQGGLGLAPSSRAVASASRRSLSTVVASTSSREPGTVGLNAARVHRDVAGGGHPALGRDEDADLRGRSGLVSGGRRRRRGSPVTGDPLDLDLSPMVALAPSREVPGRSRRPECSRDSGPASVASVAIAWPRTLSASSMNFGALATKSVSQRTSTMVPTPFARLGGDQTVGGRAALALGDALGALDPEDFGRLDAVAIGLVESAS